MSLLSFACAHACDSRVWDQDFLTDDDKKAKGLWLCREAKSRETTSCTPKRKRGPPSAGPRRLSSTSVQDVPRWALLETSPVSQTRALQCGLGVETDEAVEASRPAGANLHDPDSRGQCCQEIDWESGSQAALCPSVEWPWLHGKVYISARRHPRKGWPMQTSTSAMRRCRHDRRNLSEPRWSRSAKAAKDRSAERCHA